MKSPGDSDLSPPVLEPWSASPKPKSCLRPPTLTPHKDTPPILPCNVNLVKLKDLDLPIAASESPIQVMPFMTLIRVLGFLFFSVCSAVVRLIYHSFNYEFLFTVKSLKPSDGCKTAKTLHKLSRSSIPASFKKKKNHSLNMSIQQLKNKNEQFLKNIYVHK